MAVYFDSEGRPWTDTPQEMAGCSRCGGVNTCTCNDDGPVTISLFAMDPGDLCSNCEGWGIVTRRGYSNYGGTCTWCDGIGLIERNFR
jgi:hypothetical protein